MVHRFLAPRHGPSDDGTDGRSPRFPAAAGRIGHPVMIALASRLAPVQERGMKVALIVLWTLAAGVGLFLMVRSRIVTATTALTRDAARDAEDRPRDPPDPPGAA